MIRHVTLFGALWLLLAASLPFVSGEEAGRESDTIRKELNTERERAQALERKQERLEAAVERSRDTLKDYNGQIQTYERNLTDTQKFINAAQAEIKRIQKRNWERERIFSSSLVALSSATSAFYIQNRSRIYSESVSNAALRIARDMFDDMQDEAPRLQELRQIVAERQAYKERILNRYLPADTQKKTIQEKLIGQREQLIADTANNSRQVNEKVLDLRDELAVAELREKEMQRRIGEQKKERDERILDRKRELDTFQNPQEQTDSANVPASNEMPSPDASADRRSFASQKGRLPWPSSGEVVQLFGEFTHPQYHVKMKSYGIDVHVRKNDPIRAVAPGRVLHTGDIPGFGLTVVVDHGNDYVTVYANVKEKVGKGSPVASGQIVGETVGEGFHFQIRHGERALDPQAWLQTK